MELEDAALRGDLARLVVRHRVRLHELFEERRERGHLLLSMTTVEQRFAQLALVFLRTSLALHRRDLADSLSPAVWMLEIDVDHQPCRHRARRRIAVLSSSHAHAFISCL